MEGNGADGAFVPAFESRVREVGGEGEEAGGAVGGGGGEEWERGVRGELPDAVGVEGDGGVEVEGGHSWRWWCGVVGGVAWASLVALNYTPISGLGLERSAMG